MLAVEAALTSASYIFPAIWQNSEDWKKKYQEVTKVHKRVANEYQRLTKKAAEIIQKNRTLQTACAALERKIDTWGKKIRQLTDNIHNLEERIVKLRGQLATVTSLKDTLAKDNGILKGENSKLLERVGELEVKHAEMLQKCDDSDALKTANAALRNKIFRMRIILFVVMIVIAIGYRKYREYYRECREYRERQERLRGNRG